MRSEGNTGCSRTRRKERIYGVGWDKVWLKQGQALESRKVRGSKWGQRGHEAPTGGPCIALSLS